MLRSCTIKIKRENTFQFIIKLLYADETKIQMKPDFHVKASEVLFL